LKAIYILYFLQGWHLMLPLTTLLLRATAYWLVLMLAALGALVWLALLAIWVDAHVHPGCSFLRHEEAWKSQWVSLGAEVLC